MESVPGGGPTIDFGIGDLLIGVAAFLLVFILLGIADLLARNAKTRAGGLVGLVIVLVLIAFLPVWGTLVYLLLASFGENAHQYWSLAPRMMMAAWLKFGGIFFTGALISGVVYVAYRGSHRDKWLPMQFCHVVLVVGGIMYAAIVFVKSGAYRMIQ